MEGAIRPLEASDLPAAARLEILSFGRRAECPSDVEQLPSGRGWGAFDTAGALLAKAHDRDQGHWFGGRVVPGSGVAGVGVQPEFRRQGLAEALLASLLEAARERGAAVSVLFRTVPGLYRRLGWHDAGALTWTAVPTLALASLRMPSNVTVRPVSRGDLAPMAELYNQIGRAGGGLLDRRPVPTAQQLLGDAQHVTVAEGTDGALGGYLQWHRSAEHGPAGTLCADELLSTSREASLALLSSLGNWGAVLPTTVLRLAEPDPTAWVLPVDGVRQATRVWMLRLIDAAAAIAARGWPPGVHGTLDLEIDDVVCPWNAGRYRLVLDGGSGRLERGGRGSVSISSQGLAALYAGGNSSGLLRRAGLLSGGDERADAWLDQAAAAPRPTLLDSF